MTAIILNRGSTETFTDRELEVLSEFNEFYDQRADQLPETLEEMHSDLQWQEVLRKAQWVLHMLGWEDIEVRYVNS